MRQCAGEGGDEEEVQKGWGMDGTAGGSFCSVQPGPLYSGNKSSLPTSLSSYRLGHLFYSYLLAQWVVW